MGSKARRRAPRLHPERSLGGALGARRGLLSGCGIATLIASLLSSVTLPSVASAQQPIVERVEPNLVPIGAEVQLVGRNIDRRTRLFLGEVELIVLRRLPNRWTLRIPEGSSSGPILLRTPTDEFIGPTLRIQAARPAPRITRLEPDHGPPGTEVIVRGENFASRPSENAISIGGAVAAVQAATSTELRILVPEAATSGPLMLRIAGAEPGTGPAFEVETPTRIASITPTRAPAGAEITLRGTGFGARSRDNQLTLSGARLRILRASPTELVASLPRRARSGPLLLTVRGRGRVAAPAPFEIQVLPRLTSFEPEAAPPGATLTLRGSGFGADLRVVQVQIGERVAPIRRIADGELQVLIPEDAASGTLRVRVHALEAQARSPLRVLVPVSVSEVEPRSGGPGSIVRIRGAGFSPRTRDNSVTLSGSACEIVEASGELLQIRVPEAASGPFEVQVAGAGGARSRPFVVTSPPIVTGFEPARASPGETLHIRGRRFGTNAALIQVRLGETLLPLDSVSDDHLVVRIPEGAESGPLQVELRMQGLARSEENLEILASVLVHALEPSSLSARQELTIRGVGFPEGRIRALFEGARPVRVQRLGPAELRVRVPRTARSGPVQLTLPDGRVLMTPTLTIE